MLTEKTDTSVIAASSRSVPSVETIEKMPISSGAPAAPTVPKTSSNSTRVIGMAIVSAVARSLVTWSLMSLLIWVKPPNSTLTGPFSVASSSCSTAARSALVSSSPSTWTRIMPLSWARLASCGTRPAQYEPATVTPGSVARRWVTRCAAARVSGSSTLPPGLAISTTRFGSAARKCSESTCRPRTESESGSSKPPVLSALTTSPLNATASPASSRATSRTSLG